MKFTSKIPNHLMGSLRLHGSAASEDLIEVPSVVPSDLLKATAVRPGKVAFQGRTFDLGGARQPFHLGGGALLDAASAGLHPDKCSSVLNSEQAQCIDSDRSTLWSTLLHQGDNARMETAEERRKRKLKELCERHGKEEVARRAGVSKIYLGQLMNGSLTPDRRKDGERKERQVGEDLARAIEAGFGFARGWMDNDVDAGPGGVAAEQLNVNRIYSVAERLAVYCDRMTVQMSHATFVELLKAGVHFVDEEASQREAEAKFDVLWPLIKHGREHENGRKS